MAENTAERLADFKKMNKSAFVLGYTGEIGKELVRELATSKVFSRVVLIGRREVNYEEETFRDLEQKVIDFDKVEDHGDAFEGLDVGFCCLGTTRGKAGTKGFYKVDHDYVVNSAKLAKSVGCEHFHLVSSGGANKNSWFLYTRTKGEAEEHLKDLGFRKLSIYRPGLLLCDRTERRTAEAALRTISTPFVWAFPTTGTVPTSTVAKAMVNAAMADAVAPDDASVHVFSNKDIHQLSGQGNKEAKQKKKAAEAETKAEES